MPNREMRPLVDALIAGVPLAIVVAPVLYLAEVPRDLWGLGVVIAFGVGAASQLLVARTLWARGLGGLLIVLVLVAIGGAWAELSRAIGQPAQSGTVAGSAPAGPAFPMLPIPWPEARLPAGEAGAGRVSGPPPVGTSAVASGGGDDVETQPSTRRSEPSGGTSQIAASPAPDSRDRPAEELPATLVLRNPHSTSVEVTLIGPGIDAAPVVVPGGDDVELSIGDADPRLARITWRHEDAEHTVSWPDAVSRGDLLLIPSD